MAKQLQHLDTEKKHFENIVPYLYPDIKKRDRKLLDALLDDGIIEVSTALEKAHCKVGGHTHVSKPQGDLFRNGKYSDSKLSTVRTSSYGKSYGAPVTNLANKTGALRVQMYERKQDKFFYFVIPHRAYKHIPRSSNIEIPFDLDGTPRRRPRRIVKVNWWKFEVPDFETMSKK
jgi:hypothetical protein